MRGGSGLFLVLVALLFWIAPAESQAALQGELVELALTVVGAGIALILLAQALILPPMMRFMAWCEAEPAFAAIAASELPPWAAEPIGPLGDQLCAAGLEAAGIFPMRGRIGGGRQQFLALFLDEAGGTGAAVIAMRSANQVVSLVELNTRFDDGEEVCTANLKIPVPLPRIDDIHLYQFPDCADVAALLGLHRELVERHRSGRRSVSPNRAEAAAYLGESVVRKFHRLAAAGHYRLDERARRYRPSWRGAVAMSARIAWPFSAVRLWALRRQARTLAAELQSI